MCVCVSTQATWHFFLVGLMCEARARSLSVHTDMKYLSKTQLVMINQMQYVSSCTQLTKTSGSKHPAFELSLPVVSCSRSLHQWTIMIMYITWVTLTMEQWQTARWSVPGDKGCKGSLQQFSLTYTVCIFLLLQVGFWVHCFVYKIRKLWKGLSIPRLYLATFLTV